MFNTRALGVGEEPHVSDIHHGRMLFLEFAPEQEEPAIRLLMETEDGTDLIPMILPLRGVRDLRLLLGKFEKQLKQAADASPEVSG